MTWERTILGHTVSCTVTPLDDGIHVLLVGGNKGHIGAVSVCDPGSEPKTMTFPGHKEQYITVPWSKAIAATVQHRSCIVCGIHYDGAAPEDIHTIMAEMDRLLQQVLTAI